MPVRSWRRSTGKRRSASRISKQGIRASQSLPQWTPYWKNVQLLRDVGGDGRMRERNVSAAARGLKDVSGELGVPVMALVQLNPDRATRPDKRPQLADLRESADCS